MANSLARSLSKLRLPVPVSMGGTGTTSMGAGAVGAVSQVAGIPTGAIIEYQTNVNGSYVKWADGTMLAWATTTFTTAVDTAVGGGVGFYAPTVVPVKTMPTSFVGIPKAWKSLYVPTGEFSTGTSGIWRPPTVNSWASFFLLELFARPSRIYTIEYFALGRWF